ncbi:MAG: PilZ domain-containing protein [Deltaproteobacteria bacterium]|nr:PilZ domain-containing protein [Deltaproteobacteria bacterium]
MNDQRISPRKNLRTRVIFEDEFSEGFLYFLSTDISISGIFIESAISFMPGTKVLLKFSLYEGDEPIQVTGELARTMGERRGRGRRPKKKRPVGIGIRFMGLKPEDLKRIESFIHS